MIGQAAVYMDTYGCKFGFVSTYMETVFLKRVSTFRFLVSPVIQADQHSTVNELSARECFYFLAEMARMSAWNFNGRTGNLDAVSLFFLALSLRSCLRFTSFISSTDLIPIDTLLGGS